MKTSARFLAMLLAVVMIASAALSVSAFSDVTAGVEHATAISVLSQLGVIGGYTDGSFKPDQNVTRAEMAKLVYVLYTTFQDAGAGSDTFKDVVSNHWAKGFISWCSTKGIIGGYGNGNFGPEDNVTYDQALKMVCGALGYTEWDSAQWPIDVRMKALNDLALGEDIPSTVKGGDKLTRGQVAQIMYNALTAAMNETKTVNNMFVDAEGNKFPIPSVVNKTLAIDVWNFVEDTYKIVGTENNGESTSDKDKIAIRKYNNNKFTGNAEVKALEDLGLEAYSGKTDDLINLEITTITKDKEMLKSATVMGSVTDNVGVSYASTRKYVKINGVEYTAADFKADAEHPIAFYNDKGTEIEKNIFDEDDKLTVEFTKTIAPANACMARIIDFNGDGYVDGVVIVDKFAYEVTSFTTKSSVKYVNYKALDGSASGSTPVANVTADLKKGDVFVGAKMGNTLYAELVNPVETYATKINTKAGKVTLNEIGEVKYNDLSLKGAAVKELDTTVLGSDEVQVYYIYNGEVINTTATAGLTDYNFVILQNISETDGEFNNVTMEESVAYVATLIIDGVEKDVVLANDKAAIVNGTAFSAKELYDAVDENGDYIYRAGVNAQNKREYKYTLVAAYEEDENGYILKINENLDAENNKVIAAGSVLKYNAETQLFSIGGVNKVVIDDTSAIFYRYDKPNTSSGTFMYIDKYTKDNIADKNFEAATWGETYLAYNETDRTYTLLATILTDEIEYTAGNAPKYDNDGRLVLYAPESSSVELIDGKTYNSYIFMDNATLTNKDPEIDKTKEYNKVSNKGTEEGFLYGYDATLEKYVAVTKSANLASAKHAVLSSVLTSKDLIGYNNDNNMDKIGSDVTIWGLAEKDELGVYTQLTLAELGEMFDLVADYNEAQKAELEEGESYTDLVIDMIILSYKDSDGEDVISSIIVEIYEADEDGKVESVNSKLVDNFKNN